jgi:hypothetical protein
MLGKPKEIKKIKLLNYINIVNVIDIVQRYPEELAKARHTNPT